MVAMSCCLLIPFKQDLTFPLSASSTQGSSVGRFPGIVHSGALGLASLQDPREVSHAAAVSGGDREPGMTLVKILRAVVRGGRAEPDLGSHLPSLYGVDVMLSSEQPLRSLLY